MTSETISPQPLNLFSTNLERRISLLLELMRTGRILLVLDNLEGLLDEKDTKGHFRPDFEGYGLLLRRVAETTHQKCLLLTSREKPAVLRALEGKYFPVRSLRVTGICHLELPSSSLRKKKPAAPPRSRPVSLTSMQAIPGLEDRGGDHRRPLCWQDRSVHL